MVNAQLGAVLRHIRRLRTSVGGAGTDGELVAAFSAHNDQAAFAGLVRRYGPLVLGVCRRVLRQEQDAEDAFQATFLVLARRAGTIRKRESLGSWLHGVAYRVAMRARQQAVRRRAREARAATAVPGDPSWQAAWQEVQVILDEEIRALPEKYRAAFVLCCLEGCPQAEAARRLGVKEGTVWSRLAQARRLLRERLARRGVALSAVLAATALAAGRAPAVPAALAAATVKAASLFAGAGAVPAGAVAANVLGLARGVQKSMFPTTIKATAFLLLAAGAVALGLGAALHGYAGPSPVAAAPEPAPQPPPAAAPPAAPRAEADAVEVSGQVLGPDGKPFAGARLLLWTSAAKKRDDLPTKATTGADGRFRFAASRADLRRGAKVVATARGHGPDFVKLAPEGRQAELTLRLVEDDVPIEGRVLDLEGRPISGVTVAVTALEAGDLKAWLKARAGSADMVMKTAPAAVLDGPTSVPTDADGRVRLSGFGRGRVVQLTVRGPGIEYADLAVITQAGVADKVPAREHVYGPTFRHTVRPAKPIVGTVRDRRTGKPVAGARVVSPGATWDWPSATTDDQGRYRIDGVGKAERYEVAAAALPYFNSTKWGIKDTPGLDPLTVDFDLDRGVAVRGRLTDKVTGRPVRGRVDYVPLADNPHVGDYRELNMGQALANDFGSTGEDGSFTVIALPGPGLLMADADDTDRYHTARSEGYKVARGTVQDHHAVVRIDADEKDEKSLRYDIALEPGRTLAGTVVGPDGKPLAGVRVAGLHTRYVGERPDKLAGADFTVAGFGSPEARVLVFAHPEKRLARVQVVPADRKDPLSVRLEPTGALVGRVLDADGKPQAGVKVQASYFAGQTVEGEGTRGRLPMSVRYVDGGWPELLNGQATTDKEGRFRIAGLAPGLKYGLEAPGLVRRDLSVEPGKDNDLGDLK